MRGKKCVNIYIYIYIYVYIYIPLLSNILLQYVGQAAMEYGVNGWFLKRNSRLKETR